LNRKALTEGSLLMCAVVLIWGAFLPVSKIVLAVIDPYWLTALRYGVAALCFLLVLALAEGRSAFSFEGRARAVWLYGTAGFAGFSFLVFEGLRLTRPEHAAMILALGPVNIVLWQWFRTRHRPHAATLACIATALCGEALVVSQGDLARLVSGGGALGNLLIYLSSCCWVAFTLGGQHFPRWSPVRYTALSATLGWSASRCRPAAASDTATRPREGLRCCMMLFVCSSSPRRLLLWNMAVAKIGPLNASSPTSHRW
jgi:drug/metabolite transporter (DMT)-like permease